MHDLGKFPVMGQAVAGIEIGDVAAGDKGPLAGAGNYDDPHVVVSLDAFERRFQFQQRRHVQRVKHLRAIDRYDRDVIRGFDDNALFHPYLPDANDCVFLLTLSPA